MRLLLLSDDMLGILVFFMLCRSKELRGRLTVVMVLLVVVVLEVVLDVDV